MLYACPPPHRGKDSIGARAGEWTVMHVIYMITTFDNVLFYQQILEDMAPDAGLKMSNKEAYDKQLQDYSIMKETFLDILNSVGVVQVERHGKLFQVPGLNLHGGKCRIEYFDNTNRTLKIIPMHGDGCDRFMEHGEEILEILTLQSNGTYSARKLQVQQLFKLWSDVAALMKRKVFTPGEKKRAISTCREFVKAYVAIDPQRSITHYMHILYEHGPWFFNDLDERQEDGSKYESVSWWSSQNLESSHAARKRVFSRKTRKNRAVSFQVNNEEDKLEVGECAGIFEMFLWHWRVKYLTAHTNHYSAQEDVVTLNLSDLSRIGQWFKEKDFSELVDKATGFLPEAELLKMFGHDLTKSIDLVGYGKLDSKMCPYPLRLDVTSATTAAMDAVKDHEVVVIEGGRKVKVQRSCVRLPQGVKPRGKKRPQDDPESKYSEHVAVRKAKLRRMGKDEVVARLKTIPFLNHDVVAL